MLEEPAGFGLTGPVLLAGCEAAESCCPFSSLDSSSISGVQQSWGSLSRRPGLVQPGIATDSTEAVSSLLPLGYNQDQAVPHASSLHSAVKGGSAGFLVWLTQGPCVACSIATCKEHRKEGSALRSHRCAVGQWRLDWGQVGERLRWQTRGEGTSDPLQCAAKVAAWLGWH